MIDFALIFISMVEEKSLLVCLENKDAKPQKCHSRSEREMQTHDDIKNEGDTECLMLRHAWVWFYLEACGNL